jgi:hypothetical protein
MFDAVILVVSFVGGALLAALTLRRWQRVWLEFVHAHPQGRRLLIAASEYRGCCARPAVFYGSVTTWRDCTSREVRDRARVEWLYAQWRMYRLGRPDHLQTGGQNAKVAHGDHP